MDDFQGKEASHGVLEYCGRTFITSSVFFVCVQLTSFCSDLPVFPSHAPLPNRACSFNGLVPCANGGLDQWTSNGKRGTFSDGALKYSGSTLLRYFFFHRARALPTGSRDPGKKPFFRWSNSTTTPLLALWRPVGIWQTGAPNSIKSS